MNKRSFSGILLLTVGGILLLVGITASLTELWRSSRSSETTSLATATPESPLLVVSLPAPQSFVASPLLIRGKVYGPHDKISLQLRNANETLVDTITFAQVTPDSPQVALFQTSLIFTQPLEETGTLTLQLLANDDTIVSSEVIPLQFR